MMFNALELNMIYLIVHGLALELGGEGSHNCGATEWAAVKCLLKVKNKIYDNIKKIYLIFYRNRVMGQIMMRP